jgi:hypothetical protein
VKTLLALIAALEEQRAGGVVAFIDFESGPAETRRLLEDLDATDGELAPVLYFEPDGPPDAEDIAYLIENECTLAIIDALAGAYDAAGLDDEKRKDVERFARAWIRPLWQRGVATLAIDHVVKNSEARGKWAIGSERKTGAVDVHLGLHAVKHLHRGASGLVRVSTHKDRPGAPGAAARRRDRAPLRPAHPPNHLGDPASQRDYRGGRRVAPNRAHAAGVRIP